MNPSRLNNVTNPQQSPLMPQYLSTALESYIDPCPNFSDNVDIDLQEEEEDYQDRRDLKLCFLCNVHNSKSAKLPNRRYSNVSSILYNHRTIKHTGLSGGSKNLTLIIQVIHRVTELPLSEQIIIPFTAFSNVELNQTNQIDHSSKNCVQIPYFASISLNGYFSNLKKNDRLTVCFPSIEVKNNDFLSLSVINSKNQLILNCKEQIIGPKFDLERVYVRYTRLLNQQWGPPYSFEFLNTLNDFHFLKCQIEICIINYHSRFFLVDSIRIALPLKAKKYEINISPPFMKKKNSILSLTDPITEIEHLYTETGHPQHTHVGCKNCLKGEYRINPLFKPCQ